MNFFSAIQARLSTFGPLHLGAGTDYYPTGYVIKEGYLHAFSEQALLQGLGASGVSQLAQLAEKGNEESLLNIQNQIHASAEKLLPLASHSVWVTPGIAAFYSSRVGKVAQRESGGRGVQNKLQIQRTFSNPHNHQPVIPGSAIKGAIRTAWLDFLNQGKAPMRDPRNKRDGKESNQSLQKRLLENEGVTDDPFSLLKISDAPYQHADGIAPTEIWFSISRKRKQRPDRSPQGVQNLLECIGPWRAQAFSFDIRFMNGSRKERKTSVKAPATCDELTRICNAYYLPKLKRELEELGEREGYFDAHWLAQLQKLLAGELGQALADGKSMLLRIGKHSGAEDKTLNGARQIEIKTGKGKQSEYRDSTTEIRLAAQQTGDLKNLLPFGWVLVELSDTVLPQTHNFLRQQAEAAYQRHKKEVDLLAQRKELQKKREEAALAQRQREAEKAAIDEAERQREESASPLERKAITLEKQIKNLKGVSAGDKRMSDFWNELRNCIDTFNTEGSAAERQKLNDRIKICIKESNISISNKKEKEYKALLRSLLDP